MTNGAPEGPARRELWVRVGAALVGGLGLAGLLGRRPQHGTVPSRRGALLLVTVFVALSAGVVTAGYVIHRRTERLHRAQVERELTTITELKVGDVVQWRSERLGDGEVFHGNPDFAGLVSRVVERPEDEDARGRLRTWLGHVQGAYHYDRVLLVGLDGVPQVSVPEDPEPVAPQLVAEALRSGQVTLVDLHRTVPGGPIRLSVHVPVYAEAGDSRPLGVLVLEVDPEVYLYPLVDRWPTPSRTAETLLVRREGDEVVFLNRLRFGADAALDLRVGLDRTEMPAVRAARGEEGIVEGDDYRGVPVLACLRAVPGSPWFLVARVDLEEVYAPLRRRVWVLVGLVGSLVVAAGSTVGLLWRQQAALFYRERYEAAEALRGSEERLRHLNEVLRAVRNVNQLITHEKDRDTLLRRACEILTETRGYQSAWIGAVDSAGAPQAATESGVGAGFAAVRTQLEHGQWPECCRQALVRPGVVVLHDTLSNCVTCPLAHNYRGAAALARRIHHTGRDYGVLVVALPAAMADDEEEQSLFSELTADIGYALHGIEEEEERRRAERALATLSERQADLVQVVERLAAARDQASVMEIVRSAVRRLTGADGATFVLKDGDQCFYADEDAIEPLWKGRRFAMSACVSGWAMLHRQSVVVEDVGTDGRTPMDAYRPTFVKSLAMVPIRTDDPVGAIGAYWARPHLAHGDELRFLEMLANATAIALENSRLYHEMEERVRARTADLVVANRELEAFSYSVSHDLRTPLRAIDGFTHMLLDGYEPVLDREGRRICSVIRENTAKMGQLIDDLLSFSRLGRVEMRLSRVEMGALADAVFHDLTTPESRKRVDFRIQVDPAASAVVDPSLIRQVWTNLIGNAVKFSGKRERAVVEVRGAVQDGEVVFSVTDNGAGFDMKYVHKLFGVFQRLHRSVDFEGTGVGLALVQRVIQRHGGRVWAHGEVDHGATFSFALPCETTVTFDQSPVQTGEVDGG